MNYASGRRFPADASRSGETLRPLNQRLFGYDANAIAAYWGGLDAVGKDAERHFLQFDLVFPILFGAALATSVVQGSRLSGRPFSPLWALVLVGIGLLADWTENLTQLALLQDLAKSVPLDSGRAALASVATITKLWTAIAVEVCIVAYAVGRRPTTEKVRRSSYQTESNRR